MTSRHDNQEQSSQGITQFRLLRGHLNPATTEQQQAWVRLGVGLAVLLYLSIAISVHDLVDWPSAQLLWLAGLFILYAGGVIALLSLRPAPSRIRRTACLFVDMVSIGLGMHLTGEVGPILYIAFLWAVFSYGIRYGRAWLIGAGTIATCSYLLVVATTTYWLENPGLSIGLLAGLIILPVFLYTLLENLKNEKINAQRATKAKDRFIANISHEIRTPLNGIIGMSEMLAKTKMDSEQRECTSTIQASAQTLLDIVEDVLDMSRIASGKLQTSPTRFDLFNLVYSVTSMLSIQAEAKGLRLETEISPETPAMLTGDAHYLRQVLINLIGNAIKFTSRGKVTVRVSSEDRDKSSIAIVFEIEDSGIGIPLEQQNTIFDSFTQADDSITRRHGGTGLGTTISRSLVSLMGGDIQLKSIPGHGTTFLVTLPFQPASEEAQADEQPALDIDTNVHAEELPVTQPYTCSSKESDDEHTNRVAEGEAEKRVLVVTGRKKTSETLGYYLAIWNMDAHYAQNASQAFSMLLDSGRRGRAFEAVVIEQSGIDIDAIQFAHAIEGEESIIKPVLVLIQSATQRHSRSKLLNSGYTAVLASHFDKDKLLEIIRSPADERRQQKQDRILSPETNHVLNILVVEDNRVSQHVVEQIIDQHGHRFTTINNGKEALELLASEKFDIAIVDLHMPDMSGIDLANQYRLMRIEHPVPLIVLTANVTPEAEQSCYDAGISAFLGKPVTSQRLLSTIDQVLGGDAPERFTQPAENSDEQAVLDSDSLNELVALDSGNGFLLRLCASFEEDSDTLLERMRTEIDRADFGYIRELIHALKGSAGNVGAASFQERCAYYCNMSENELLDNQQTILSDLSTHFTEARHALREFIEEYNSMTG